MKPKQYDGKGRKETLYFFLLNFVSKSVTYVVLLLLANLFTLQYYGKAAHAISLFNIVLLLLLVGIPETFVSWCVKKRDASSVAYFLTFLALFFVAVALAIFWHHIWLLPLILSLPFFLMKGFSESFFRIEHKYHLVQGFGIVTMILYLLFLLLFRNLQEFGILLSYSLAYFTVALVMFCMLFGKFKKLFQTFRLRVAPVRLYFKKGIVTAIVSVSFAFLTWIDASILGFLSTFENVARYNVSGSIAAVALVVPVAISMFLLTRSAELKNNKTAESLLKRSIRITVFLSVSFAILIVSFISPFLRILFSQYVGIEHYIAILLFGLMFAAVNHVIAMYFSGRLEPEIILFPVMFAALFNVLLDFLLIPAYGLYGITIATTIAHFSALCMFLRKVKLTHYLVPLFFVSFFIIGAFYLHIFGIFVILPLIFFLLHVGLLQKKDIIIIVDVIKSVFRKT